MIYFLSKKIFGTKNAPLGSYAPGQKWLCVPCGFVYDPEFGDPDSGIAPGTEFSEIPDIWKCPVCGVTKSDFIPMDNKPLPTLPGRVVEKELLNPTTLALTIELEQEIQSVPGQFMGFEWQDDQGFFQRSYSIVHHEGARYSFTIKLGEHGRGAALLRKIVIGGNVEVRGVFGKFILQNTEHPKVFIATGTGLAPIYRMLKTLPKETPKTLYFSVATEAEIYYANELKLIPKLNLNIHVTREEVVGYRFGRVDIVNIDAHENSEWYLCGNEKMVREAREILKKR